MKLNMLLQNKAVIADQTAHWTWKLPFCNTQKGKVLAITVKSVLCCKVKSTFIR